MEEVWWLCPKGHDYKVKIGNRTRRNPSGCPHPDCKKERLRIKKETTFPEVSLKVIYPELCKEWHPTKNFPLTPGNYTSGSNEKVWWLCPIGHEYDSPIKTRTNGNKCPYCSGKRVSNKNRLSIRHPELVEEWHPTKNGSKKPQDYSYAARDKVWWLCPNGHEYDVGIRSRTTKQRTGCPSCSNQSSRPEIRILTELKYIFGEVLSRYKVGGVEIDIFIPKFSIGVEYDGSHWHAGKDEKDKIKNNFLEQKKINLLRVREVPLKKLMSSDISVLKQELDKKVVNLIVAEIGSRIHPSMKDEINAYINNDTFNNEKLFQTYVSYFPKPFPEHSLQSTHPDLCKEWHPTKNAPLTPENFSYGSAIKVWWLCPKGHDYKVKIGNRTRRNPSGCPHPDCKKERLRIKKLLSLKSR